MSESSKNVQPIQELTLQQKYINVCTQLGDTVYRVGLVERQLDALRKQQVALAAEAENLQVQAAQANQVAAQQPAEKSSGTDQGTV